MSNWFRAVFSILVRIILTNPLLLTDVFIKLIFISIPFVGFIFYNKFINLF